MREVKCDIKIAHWKLDINTAGKYLEAAVAYKGSSELSMAFIYAYWDKHANISKLILSPNQIIAHQHPQSILIFWPHVFNNKSFWFPVCREIFKCRWTAGSEKKWHISICAHCFRPRIRFRYFYRMIMCMGRVHTLPIFNVALDQRVHTIASHIVCRLKQSRGLWVD